MANLINIRVVEQNDEKIVHYELDNGKEYVYLCSSATLVGLKGEPIKTTPKMLKGVNLGEGHDMSKLKYPTNKIILSGMEKRLFFKGMTLEEVCSKNVIDFLDKIDNETIISNKIRKEYVNYLVGNDDSNYRMKRVTNALEGKKIDKKFMSIFKEVHENNNYYFQLDYTLNLVFGKVEFKEWLEENHYMINELYTEDFYKNIYDNFKDCDYFKEYSKLIIFYGSQLYPLTETIAYSASLEEESGLSQEQLRNLQYRAGSSKKSLNAIFRKSTMHDIISQIFELSGKIGYTPQKNNVLKELQKIRLMFIENQKNKDGSYREQKLKENQLNKNLEFENDIFKIIVPTSVAQFANESLQQKNCVFAYHTDHVVNGLENIVFLRLKEDLEKSYITISLDKDKKVISALGKYNHGLTKEQQKLLEQYKIYLSSL